MAKTVKFWLVINGNGRPLADEYCRMYIFYKKKFAREYIKLTSYNTKKYKLKRFIVNATILWQKK